MSVGRYYPWMCFVQPSQRFYYVDLNTFGHIGYGGKRCPLSSLIEGHHWELVALPGSTFPSFLAAGYIHGTRFPSLDSSEVIRIPSVKLSKDGYLSSPQCLPPLPRGCSMTATGLRWLTITTENLGCKP